MSKMLSAVTKGKIRSPVTAVLYSPEGVGKSTFAMSAPKPIYIPTEDGTNELNVTRFPRPGSWVELLACVEELATEKHDYETAVLDTLDGAEPLCWAHVIAEANKSRPHDKPALDSIEAFGFGKGYVAAVEAWRALRGGLDRLKAKGMNVVLLAHSTVKTFKSPDPSIEPFQRYELKLNGQAASLWKEWPDAVLFANHEILTTEKEKRVIGVSSGARFIHTVHTAAWDAKNRYSLPEKLPLSWAEFEKAIETGRSTMKDSVAAEIRALAEKAPDAMKKDVDSALVRAGGDVDKLNTLLNWLRTKVNQ